MKDYWFLIDYETMTIEICFPDRMGNNINACLATISEKEIRRMLEILQEIDRNSKPVRLGYEYFTMDIDCGWIDCVFHMFDEPVRFFLYTEIFREALAEYLVTLDELMKSRD